MCPAGPITLNDKNQEALSQKFRQLICQEFTTDIL